MSLPQYEVIIVLDPSLAEEAQEREVAAVTGLVSREGGQIFELQRWGKKRLAYEVKKRREGSYIYLLLDGPPKLVKELERQFKISESVLKYITVRKKKPKRGPAPPEKAASAVMEVSTARLEEAS